MQGDDQLLLAYHQDVTVTAPPSDYIIYCDESCHLERDGMPNMVLGAVTVTAERVREVNAEIRGLKERHGYHADWEIKWMGVSRSRVAFYADLIDYFIESDHLTFRAWVAPKDHLRHGDFAQTHDEWYYKMYYFLLQPLVSVDRRYRIYVDIKDTRGGRKVDKLHEVLSNSLHDFERQVVERIQIVRSDEVQLIQLTDLLIGAVGYANRGLRTSPAKLAVIRHLQARSGVALTRNSRRDERKVNLFHWRPRAASG